MDRFALKLTTSWFLLFFNLKAYFKWRQNSPHLHLWYACQLLLRPSAAILKFGILDLEVILGISFILTLFMFSQCQYCCYQRWLTIKLSELLRLRVNFSYCENNSWYLILWTWWIRLKGYVSRDHISYFLHRWRILTSSWYSRRITLLYQCK